jgi:hypothetical protein
MTKAILSKKDRLSMNIQLLSLASLIVADGAFSREALIFQITNP